MESEAAAPVGELHDAGEAESKEPTPMDVDADMPQADNHNAAASAAIAEQASAGGGSNANMEESAMDEKAAGSIEEAQHSLAVGQTSLESLSEAAAEVLNSAALEANNKLLENAAEQRLNEATANAASVIASNGMPAEPAVDESNANSNMLDANAGNAADSNTTANHANMPSAEHSANDAQHMLTDELNNAALPATPQKIVPRFVDEEDAKWHSVGIFQGLNATVTNFIDNSQWTSSGLNINSENLPDLSAFQRVNLEPGTAYRFRLRAINSVGAGEWSEVSSFKTCLPGFPGAPSAIKISKSSEGAHLTWEPPPSCLSSNEVVEEYSVYLAVKPGKDKEGKLGGRTPAQLAFVRVYVGAANQCTVAHSSLAAAHVDCSNKPAIIFRIAARNEKGYGPATQVRWLQDTTATGGANAGGRAKAGDMTGASPNKRFKANTGRSIAGTGGD